MAYDKFEILKSTAVPLPIENVDTDQIIPARFLKATKREGFGDNLFRDWRYYGEGSSREHAAWSVYDYGFRCVVSSFFADIFRNNCLNIGVLPVQVTAEFLDKIFKAIEADPNAEFEVNLIDQTITITSTGEHENFDINSYKKENMLNGYDDIDYLQSMKSEIKEFAASRPF